MATLIQSLQFLLAQKDAGLANETKRILLKEYLQTYTLDFLYHVDEALHLKVEISQHRQISVLRRTPVLAHGRSFVLKHFSLETMMAGKMLACLERNFQVGNRGIEIKGRDFYDLLWFMHQKTRPLEEKLAKEGTKPYTVKSAFEELTEKVGRIRRSDLAADLLPLFEQRSFIEAWLDGFQENFALLAADYIKE